MEAVAGTSIPTVVTARLYLTTDTLTGPLIADDRDRDQVMRAHRARIT
jgi:hypothetical protein